MRHKIRAISILQHPWICLAISFTITIVVKIPHLGFPYSWDEAYSYYPAILKMAENGPGLLPGSIPIHISKGHPLLFYFLFSSWIKYIAGSSTILTRIFSLLIALFALWGVHRFAKRHINIELANISAILLSMQGMFLAQASLVLPELFLMALFMFAFDSYLAGNYKQYALWGSLMMLTKETAAVFILVFGMCYLFERYRHIRSTKFWATIIWLAIPVVVYGVFLILHKLKFGTFFLNEHLEYITIESSKVIYKLKSAASTLFLKQGRNSLFFIAVLALGYLVFKKINIRYNRFFLISLLTIVVFLIFTTLNFYTYRYILPIMGIFLLSCLTLIQQVKMKNNTFKIVYLLVVGILTTFYSVTKRGKRDVDLGYTQYLPIYEQMVSFCEQQDWHDKEFGAGFNMVMGMRDQHCRLLPTTNNFHMHHLPGIKGRDYIIFDSTCQPCEMPANEKKHLKLIKRFEQKKHWGEIYQVTTNNP